MRDIPQMNVHIDGTPDVPDIVHPGDWIVETDEIGDVFSIVIKTEKCKEGEYDLCPSAESYTIYHLGIGYLTGEKLSKHNCCFLTQIVAVNGELLSLYKLGWNEIRSVRVCQKPDDIEVPKTVESLIKRMNADEKYRHPISFVKRKPREDPLQLSLFTDDLFFMSSN